MREQKSGGNFTKRRALTLFEVSWVVSTESCAIFEYKRYKLEKTSLSAKLCHNTKNCIDNTLKVEAVARDDCDIRNIQHVGAVDGRSSLHGDASMSQEKFYPHGLEVLSSSTGVLYCYLLAHHLRRPLSSLDRIIVGASNEGAL